MGNKGGGSWEYGEQIYTKSKPLKYNKWLYMNSYILSSESTKQRIKYCTNFIIKKLSSIFLSILLNAYYQLLNV